MKNPPGAMLLSVLTLLVLVGCTLAVWLRNRDILRDLFDYSTVIVSVGKIEAGFKPYTGVRSPMQTSVYLLNYLTEQVFGRNYLALTWGGLIQALGGGLLLRALISHRVGAVRATVVALAVVLAGLLQHMVFFYNPVGILCFALVLLGLAAEPALWPVRSWRQLVILGALFLGALNKLNFLGATLVLAGILSLGAWTSARIPFRALVSNGLLTALFGVVLPFAFELGWTGATPRLWFENVVLMPSARRAALNEAMGWEMYLRPVHDFHHHLLVRPIAGIGVLLVLLVGGWMVYELRMRERPWRDWIARLSLLGAGLVMSALLMISNNETVMLTSLAYLIVAVAGYLNFPDATATGRRWIARVIFSATLVWVVAGGYAAWHGSRLLFGLNPPPRSEYVALHSTSRALAYFNGVRLLPSQIDASERLAAKLRTMEDAEGKLQGVLFGAGLEWLERAYPEAIVDRSPIWYDAGTTLHESDLGYFDQLLDTEKRRLVVQRAWQAWPSSIQHMLERDYRVERVSGRDVMYHPRSRDVAPVAAADRSKLAVDAFRDATGSNVQIASTRYSSGMAVTGSAVAPLFGADRNTTWNWPLGASDASGMAVARLLPGATRPGKVIFRAIAGDPENGELLWEIPVAVGPERREVVLPVMLQPGARPVWLQTELPEDSARAYFAGWREMRITRTSEQDRSVPPAFGRDLVRTWPDAAGEGTEQVWYSRTGQRLSREGWATLPAEDWRRDTLQSGKLSVTVEFKPDPANPGDHVVVALAWYRASRFEIMTEKEIDVRATPGLTLEAYVPEPGGWVGLLVRTGSAQHSVRTTVWSR